MSHQEVPEYDLIIVGGGTSGCVLANRLSEDPRTSVLVLEAGEDRSADERIYTPGLAGSMWDNPQFDWQYISEPSPGINNRHIKHPRGRLIGGTSAINSFAIIYPSAAGIDAWAELGNEGWDWETLKPYFLKFQTIVPPSEDVKRELNIMHIDESIRKSNGPIQASFPLRVTPFQKAWVETFRTLDLETATDPLDGHAIGGHTSTCHITGDRHERSHAGWPIDNDGAEPTVRGVVYSQDGVLHEVRAKQEVILAAGTFNTPQLLELSGIGNPSILEQHGIDIVHANPAVGENLQDHIRPGLSFELADDAPPRTTMPTDEARKLYEKKRTGPWAEQGAFAFAYTPLVPSLNPEGTEQLQSLLDHHLKPDPSWSPFIRQRNAYIRKVIESASEATAVTFLSRKPPPDVSHDNYITLFSMLSHPFSAGGVHIVSPDPETKPKVDFNYYSHPLDVEIHARHVQVLEQLAKTEPLASYMKPDSARLPAGYATDTLDGAKALTKAFATTNYHPCGTCSLGEVVDGRLRVKGVKGLRVVDASVMPIIPRGNIIATVYAVAERGADVISEDLGVYRCT